MYERFTDRARKVMQLANGEAQRFNHEYIGTEHILLGLIQEGSGVAANVLKNLYISLLKVRQEIEKLVQPGLDVEAGLDELLDLLAHLEQADVEVLQHVGRHAGAFLDEAEQDVFGPDVFVIEALRLAVGELHHLPRPIGEPFVHLCGLHEVFRQRCPAKRKGVKRAKEREAHSHTSPLILPDSRRCQVPAPTNSL